MNTDSDQYGPLPVDARYDKKCRHRISVDDPLDLRAVVEELARHIADARKPTADGQGRSGKIGLFGGQGQGKTTALMAALALHEKRLVERGQKPLDVWHYDAAKVPPDQVEWEFDRWVLQRFFYGTLRAWWATLWAWRLPFVIVVGLLLTVAGMVIYALEILKLTMPIGVSVALWVGGASISVPSLTVVVATLGKYRPVLAWAAWSIREIERRLNLSLACRSNSLIVVDNLDRASVVQQRAVLRTLDKHRDDLNIPFVVVMDDTALRTGSNDPEPPAELFRKVVELEIQMPTRGIVQIARIVGTLADELALANKLWVSRRLRGDLARLFTLLPSPVSPRIISRFLNDLSSRCRQHGLSEPEDVSAMARVLAVGQILPPLRADQHRMVGAIAANDIEQLRRLWESLTTGGRGPLPADVARLFHLTRHLIPRNGDWQRVLASADRLEGIQPKTNSNGEGLYQPPFVSEKHMLARRQLVRRLSEVLPRLMGGFGSWDWRSPRANEAFMPDGDDELPHLSADEVADTVWPVIEAFLAAANSPIERLRVFDYVRETLGETLGPDLLRVWLGDAEVLNAMHPLARAGLLRRVVVEDAPFRDPTLLLAMPPDYLAFYDRILIVTHAGFGAPDRHSVAPWLGDQGAGAEPLNLVRPGSMRSPSAVVEAGWPPFQGEELSIQGQAVREELAWHFDTLKVLHDRMIPVFPASLAQALLGRQWLYHQAKEHPLIVLKALSTLVTSGGMAESYPNGVVGAWNDSVLKVLAAGRELVFQDVVRLIARPDIILHGARPPMAWFALFLVITFFEGSERETLCRDWWNALSNGTGPVCLDPWFMEFLLRLPSSPLPIEDEATVAGRIIDVLFGKALAGFNLPSANLDIEEQIVIPLRAKLKNRADASRWM